MTKIGFRIGILLAVLVSSGCTETIREEGKEMDTAGFELAADKQDIEELQRLYAKATDLIGKATDEDVAAGRAIYHRIFTPDVAITTSNTGADPLTAASPDEWADVVLDALRDYTGTQHLIGTQLVEVEGDAGSMESYLNAWHKNPDDTVYYFLGTYISDVKKTDVGWQIHHMNLRHDTSGTVQTQ